MIIIFTCCLITVIVCLMYLECLSQKKSAFDCSTNFPVEAMAFPDFPFSKDMPSFVKHTVVHKYLEDYADHVQLRDHIKVGNDM